MSEDSEQITVEQESTVQTLSHKRILILMAFAALLGSVAGFVFAGTRFGIGVLIGGALSLANYYWLKRSLKTVFEQAIEGAGHLGNKDIARYLIENGARPNIYVLTMLGETGMVKSILMKYPQLLNGKGPHGFTLLHHATKGGDDARELLEFFKEKGLTEMQIRIK